MCDCAVPRPAESAGSALGRRTLLGAGLGAAGGLALAAAQAAPAAAVTTSSKAAARAGRTHAVLVGTSGGPIWWEDRVDVAYAPSYRWPAAGT
jgi:hypothetical protein